MADELAVWLYGECVAIVDHERGRPRLVYTSEALGQYDLGTPLLSLSYPSGPGDIPRASSGPSSMACSPRVSLEDRLPETLECAKTIRTA